MKGSDAIRGIPYSELFRCPECGRDGLYHNDVEENVKKVVIWWNGKKDFYKSAWKLWGDPMWWKDFFRIVTCKCGQRWWTHSQWMGVVYCWEDNQESPKYEFRLIDQDLIDRYKTFLKKTRKWEKEKKARK